jgi:hypothetical protein
VYISAFISFDVLILLLSAADRKMGPSSFRMASAGATGGWESYALTVQDFLEN